MRWNWHPPPQPEEKKLIALRQWGYNIEVAKNIYGSYGMSLFNFVSVNDVDKRLYLLVNEDNYSNHLYRFAQGTSAQPYPAQ